MNYTLKHIVPAKNIPANRVHVHNIFISIFSVLLLSVFTIGVKAQTVTFSPAGPICVGSSITVNISGGGNNKNWITDIYNGSPGTLVQNLGTVSTGSGGSSGIGANTFVIPASAVGTGLFIRISSAGLTTTYSASSFTVNAASVGGTVNNNATVCSGNNNGTLNLTGQTGNVIRWESSINGTTWTSITNTTTSQSYNNLTATTQYRAVVQNGVCATANSSAATISMPSALAASFTPTTSVTACPNYNPGIFTSTVSNGISPYTYNWQQSSSTTGPWTTVGTTANYTSSNLTSTGTYVYQLVVTDACGTSVTTAQKIITIVSEATILIPPPSGVCVGASLTLNSSVSNGTGTYTYKWQSSASSGGPWTDVTAFTTTSTYSPSTSAAGTTYYQVIVSPSGAACNNATSNVVSVVVNPLPTAFSVTGGGSYCSGGTGVAVGLSGSENGVNYQLKINGTNTGSPVAGTGSAITFGNQLTAGTYTVVATNGTTSCAANMTGSVSVTVNPSSISNNDITVVSSTCSVILQGTTPTTSCCSFTYQWYTSVDNSSPASFSAVPGAIGKDYTPPSGSQNNWFYRMVICADGTTSQSASTVHAHAPMTVIASGQVNINCYGGSTGSITFNVSTGNPKYSYTWATSSGTVLASSSNIATDFNVTFNNLSAGNYVFTVTDQDNPTPCTQVRNITITQPAASLSVSTPSATYCSGSTYTITATASGGTLPYSYQWQNNGSNISGATSSSYNASAAGTYSVIVTDFNGCTATSSGNVIISSIPTVTNSPLSQTICSGNTTTAVTLTSNVSGTTFIWSATGSAGVSGFQTSGSNTIPAQTISTTGTTAGTVTYTITPTGPSPTNCPGTVATYTVTVNPTPTITNQTTITCSATAFTLTPANGGGNIIPAGTTYSWSAPAVTGGLTGGVAGSGSSITGTLTNPTNSAQTATYTVTPTLGSCTGTAFTVTVTVNPKPSVVNQTSTTCSATAFTVTPANGGSNVVPAGTTYSWSAPVVTGGLTGGVAGSGSSITGTLTNPTNSAQTATYTVTPTSGSCTGATFTVTVTVGPVPSIVNQTSSICSGGNFTITPANGGSNIIPAGTTYSWSAPAVTGGLTGGVAGSGSSITGTLTNPTNSAQTATYTVTPASGSCTGATFTVTVTVNVTPSITITPSSATICSGSSTTLTASGATSYVWNTGATTAAITVSPASTTTYSVTGISLGCTSNLSATVTLNTVTAGAVGSDQTLCSGGAPNAFAVTTPATGTGTLTYQWQSSTTSSTSGFSDISGATSATLSPSAISQNTWYWRIATSTLNGVTCSSTPTTAIAVSVYPLTAGTVAADQTICSGLIPAILTSTATTAPGGTNFSNQWQSSNDGGATWNNVGTVSTGQIPTSYTSTALTQTTKFRLSVTGIKNTGPPSGQFNCTVYSNVITIIVNQLPTIGGALNVCVGSNTQLTGSGSPAAASPWTSSNTAIATVSNSGLVSGVAPGTATITYTDSNGCKQTATINVNAKPSPTIYHN